ncbi:hypothetical protein SERLADRAFT_350327 [Serpula lacrymans var. lacrymans S7.9]|uniref:Cytochrome P450 n=1 Tax=Serpula lacrymans var. lacrymans (strain S7.9) TaxID=578457 RepID=F8P228_SERL9|nr:uncharacterized protein SERLADRAFT_350327 [Serpula lacrymans var. lacrymans S7.9]EGO23206.1 hypothetical protein SERLADRAFT_350327 [Serpula lacrymans var. lacrymans S7.9]
MFEAVNLRSTAVALLFAVFVGVTRYLLRKTATRNSPPFPPGPPQLPIVGNALGIDSAAPWITYKQWGNTYGDIIYSRLFNQDIIVINSEKIAKDLLEKRSTNYSDRPFIITIEMFGWTFNSAFLRYGHKWRQHRRLFHEQLRPVAALSYRPLHMQKTHQLLIDILEAPKAFAHHLQAMTASTIMSIIYGYEIEHWNDPLVAVIEEAAARGFEVVTPEASAVLVLHLPSWFPGAGFKRRARKCYKITNEMIERPFLHTKKLMDSNSAPTCMVTNLLNRIKGEDNYDELEKVIKSVASTSVIGEDTILTLLVLTLFSTICFLSAASETTTSTLLIFVLAMVLYPHVQVRAQAEIDSFIGKERLPTFDDRHSLPYVEAVVRETLRWQPVGPLGELKRIFLFNFFSGATVVANAWAMSRNEAKYPNPSEFIPERFFTAEGKLNDDKVNYAFGFGRRICVGQNLADAAVWAAVVSILAVFKLIKAKDDQGIEIDIEPQ